MYIFYIYYTILYIIVYMIFYVSVSLECDVILKHK